MSSKMGTLWIGDLESYMDETFLKHAFTLMGENLQSAKVIRNRFTGASMGYGFLDFGDEATSLRVLHRCNSKIIPNASPPKRFKLNHASYGKESPAQKEWSLFVGDLSEDVDDLALFDAFSSRYPSVKAAKVVLDSSGESKGYGFIRFFSETEYNNALVDVQNRLIVGCKPIRVSIATPKNRTYTTSHNSLASEETAPSPPTTATAAAATTTAAMLVPGTGAAYYPYGYDYQSYYAAWQQYQQYYSYAAYDPAAYAAAASLATADGTQTYDYTQAQQQTTQQAYYDTNYEADNAIEEHDIPLDIEQLNMDCMARNDDLYASLETSRWLPTEGLDPPIIFVK